ncbi:TIGR01459 family HAD-type hydrolase [Azospirillum sp. RWY-5-1]|uniref:TIGR01459 family HAD-type hydrolase n=1 Tax=Azospirillum oleiclasticum TaxID=2735135 RepID=A0ABX2TBK7_9PROT|nr:TIGR01459 family HAD-type hydrolase [Azospirillum oleiclasticum]NYZ12908.1 TIGR01459 family HAD-type hydrolase [Azospirillum oleiclasticum]NYZ20419.1 TIGR01459 family HAD-type hydrolase [Azospirillum oleiclasticum]
MPDFQTITGLSQVIDRYDGVILDLWGVIHDGGKPYDGVPDCLDRLAAAGKAVCLLSNAPRRTAGVEAKLSGMGIGPDRYQHVMTSGEAAFEALRDRNDPWHAKLGNRLYHLGPKRDRDVFETLGCVEAASPDAADFVLNTGTLDFDDTLDVYVPVLEACAAAGLPMICANPDLVVLIGDQMALCAGTLAQHYETLGREVAYHGKPHAPVYRRCLELMGGPDRQRVLAIGDSFRTDVAGANAAGIDSAFVTGGIHREELGIRWGETPDPERLAMAAATAGQTPTYVIPRLVW